LNRTTRSVSLTEAGAILLERLSRAFWEAAAGRDLDLEAQPDAARILLCEDDRDTATAARERLRSAGFATDFAYTAAAAIACADATEYAAILVDLQLPDDDGTALILNLRARARYRDTPIIVVSIDPTRGRDDVRSSKLDVLGWLGKPVHFDRLIKVLQTSIGSPPTKSTATETAAA
jgi:DNA-binding response OmpR family regulator